MQEVFEKLKQRIRICATEACGYTPLTRVVSEAELKEIIEQIAAEYSNGHFGCNTNGEHERCDGCGLMDCKSRNKIWFGAMDDDTDINVGNNGWIPCSERLPKYGEVVMCSCTNSGITISCITHKGVKPSKSVRFGQHSVIAWQPLPQPYHPKGE